MNKVALIGHRQIFDETLRERLKLAIEEKIKNGCNFFTMGTHGEFDKMALGVCRELRKIYKDIDIEVVITSLNQIKPIIEHDEFFGDEKYVPYSDVKTIMYDIEDKYFKNKIFESNKQMINTCTTLICYVNARKNPSGAKRIMNYAKKKGLQVINLYVPK